MNTQTRLAACLAAAVGAVLSNAAAQSEHDGHQAGHNMTGHSPMEHCGVPMGEGALDTVDIGGSKVSVAHEAVDWLGWQAGTRSLSVGRLVDLAAFAPGERVHFLLRAQKNDDYDIAMMCSLDVDDGMHDACMTRMHGEAEKLAAEAGSPCASADNDPHGHH